MAPRLCPLALLALLCAVLPAANCQCLEALTFNNGSSAPSATFALPISALCSPPTLDYACTVQPPASGSALSFSLALRAVGSDAPGIELLSWQAISGSAVTADGSLPRCDMLLLADALEAVVSGTQTGAASSWSFTFTISAPPATLEANESTDIALGPGLYRTYLVNLTADNGTQAAAFALAGPSIERYLPAALFGASVCPIENAAYTWQGNASGGAFTTPAVPPGEYYLTLIQNEKIAFNATTIIFTLTPQAVVPPIPVWWFWSCGAVVIVGVISFYILLDAMRQPLGSQRTRI